MRILKTVTVAMAVLIIAGTALLAALIVRRVSPHAAAAAPLVLAEPPGTRLAGIAAAGTGLALRLEGGGPDRILIIDPSTLRVTGRIALPPSLDPHPHLP